MTHPVELLCEAGCVLVEHPEFVAIASADYGDQLLGDKLGEYVVENPPVAPQAERVGHRFGVQPVGTDAGQPGDDLLSHTQPVRGLASRSCCAQTVCWLRCILGLTAVGIPVPYTLRFRRNTATVLVRQLRGVAVLRSRCMYIGLLRVQNLCLGQQRHLVGQWIAHHPLAGQPSLVSRFWT